MPLGGIYKLLRTGKVKVNKKKMREDYRLQIGDEVYFFFDTIDGTVPSPIVPSHPIHTLLSDSLTSPLYQDPYLFIINKPAGVNVHPWDHKTKERSLIEAVHDMLWDAYTSLTFRPSLVHRIDRDTSGCVMIALEKSTLEGLLEQLRSHTIEKIYHTIVLGTMSQESGTIRDPLIRNNTPNGWAKVSVHTDWDSAITHYRVLRTWNIKHIQLSLLECRIETGRTHQIRVHLSHYNCPILWDTMYGNRSINSYFSRHYGIHRQMLHAFRLWIKHPHTWKRLFVEAPYFPDMNQLLSYEITS